MTRTIYAPNPARTVLSGVLPPGASDAVLLGVGAPRRLRLDANNAFLVVTGGRYWDTSPRITYMLHGHRVGSLASGERPRLFPFGTSPQIPQVRAPDPDGGRRGALQPRATARRPSGASCDGRFASIDLSDGVLKSGAERTGWSSSCTTHPEAFTPPSVLHQPIEFDDQQAQAAIPLPGRAPEPFSRPEIERRTLPGRTIITGIARANVVSVTLSTPSDVRTLRPSGPLHALLAVYDGFFLRGEITATVRLRGGKAETEQIVGPGGASFQPAPLSVRLREARRLLAQAHARAAASRLSTGAARAYVKLAEEHLRGIERHVAFERAHPGVLPAE